MARPLRLEFPGATYHLTARGNAQQVIFLDAQDYTSFLVVLGREIAQQGWYCYAYCLMPNHYHLLMETPEANLIQGMRRVNGVYAQTFNHRYHRVGHLFQGRYKSIIVEREAHLLELTRYIVLNPVRAQMVPQVDDWPWSSYRATAKEIPAPSWLRVTELLAQFAPSEVPAAAAYQRFVREGLAGTSPWDNLRGQIWLGSEPFLATMASMIPQQALHNVPSGQTAPMRPQRESILAVVGAAYNIPPDTVLDRSHQPAFRAGVYLLRRVANLPLKEVASLAGISSPRVSQIQRQVTHGELDAPLQSLLMQYQLKN